MLTRRRLARVLGIQRVLVKYGLDEIITATHLLRPLRFLFYFFPRRRDQNAPRGVWGRNRTGIAGVAADASP